MVGEAWVKMLFMMFIYAYTEGMYLGGIEYRRLG